MSNKIKYNTSIESNALRSGNFYIGTGDVDKGPTVNYYWDPLANGGVGAPTRNSTNTQGSLSLYKTGTDYWACVDPYCPNTPSTFQGGYTLYKYRGDGIGPVIYTANDDTSLINILNNLSGQSFTSLTTSLDWCATQNDYLITNKKFESIITDGLIFHVDAGNVSSFPANAWNAQTDSSQGRSQYWYDLSKNSNRLVIGGTTSGPTNRMLPTNYPELGVAYINDYFNQGYNKAITENNLDLTSPTNCITLSMWASATPRMGVDSTAVALSYGVTSNSSTNGFSLSTYYNDWRILDFHIGRTGNTLKLFRDSTFWVLNSNSRVNITIVIDQPNSSVKLYRNGFLRTGFAPFDGVGAFNFPSTLSKLGVGGMEIPFGLNQGFSGWISEVSVYNRALSATEVMTNVNYKRDRYEHLHNGYVMAYQPLD
jgi:hypothetical protein